MYTSIKTITLRYKQTNKLQGKSSWKSNTKCNPLVVQINIKFFLEQYIIPVRENRICTQVQRKLIWKNIIYSLGYRSQIISKTYFMYYNSIGMMKNIVVMTMLNFHMETQTFRVLCLIVTSNT